ncbi:MAG: transcriptional repressor [Proteobacteria bacterium]|nr:transcriptional repressor [Pseudomonadota bacterium]
MTMNNQDIREKLEAHGVLPTAQRIDIARLLFTERRHYTAEDIYNRVNAEAGVNGNRKRASKATIYNTLGLFTDKGLVKEVIADPSRVFYDSFTGAHYHLYNTLTGELSDIEHGTLEISGLPELPEGAELEGVEVIVRYR